MPKGPILGIDFGTRSMGLSISDEEATFALPLFAVKALKDADCVKQIEKICLERGVRAIVLGLPLNEDMTESPLSEKIKVFAKQLEKTTGLDVHFEDEHLTTFQADRLLGQKKNVSKADRDAVAAQIILQNFLDRCYDR